MCAWWRIWTTPRSRTPSRASSARWAGWTWPGRVLPARARTPHGRAGLRPRLLGSDRATVGRLARARVSVVRSARSILEATDRPLRVALLVGVALLLVSTLVLHYGYHRPGSGSHLSLVDALYFTVET